MKNVSDLLITEYVRQSGVVILVRDEKLFRQGKDTSYFYSVLDTTNCFAFEKVNSTDRIYVFPDEATIVKGFDGACLEKYRYTSHIASTFNKLLELLNEGKFVGAASDSGKRKYMIRIDSTKFNNGTGISEMEAINQDGNRADGLYRYLGENQGRFKNFVYTDNQFEFWKWFLV